MARPGPLRGTRPDTDVVTSDRVDLISLGPLGPRDNVELDLLSFIKGTEPRSVNGGVMDENVRASTVDGNEAVALLGIEVSIRSLR